VNGAAARARTLLAEGLGWWRGEPLAGAPGPWAETQRRRLGELRVRALEQAAALDLDLGRPGEVVAQVTQLVSEYPLRENLHALLMLALYRSGRQAEALAAYSAVHRLLLDEVGTGPGRALRELQAAVLAEDPALLPRTAVGTSGQASASGQAGAPSLPVFRHRLCCRTSSAARSRRSSCPRS